MDCLPLYIHWQLLFLHPLISSCAECLIRHPFIARQVKDTRITDWHTAGYNWKSQWRISPLNKRNALEEAEFENSLFCQSIIFEAVERQCPWCWVILSILPRGSCNFPILQLKFCSYLHRPMLLVEPGQFSESSIGTRSVPAPCFCFQNSNTDSLQKLGYDLWPKGHCWNLPQSYLAVPRLNN